MTLNTFSHLPTFGLHPPEILMLGCVLDSVTSALVIVRSCADVCFKLSPPYSIEGEVEVHRD